MKRLVSLLLVVCMLLPCMVYAEQFEADDSMFTDGDLFSDTFVDEFDETVDETVQEPEEEEDEVVLPEKDNLVIMENDGVDGPDPYRELVLLEPTDLFGVALSTTSIRLAWSPVGFATRYDVYRKTGSESEYSWLTSTPSNQTNYVDTGVRPGEVVYYRVQAVNVSYDGDTPVLTYSPQSNTLPFITLEKPVLSDPRGIDDDSVRLNWTSVNGVGQYGTYEVEVATSKDGPYTLARQDLRSTLCNVDGLPSGEGRFFRVRALRIFSSGEKFYSDWSEPKCGTAMARPSLSVVADGSNAVLSWTACPGATGYVIYRKVGGGAYSKLTIVGDVTTYVDAGRTPGEVCYYYVYATTPFGDYNTFSLSSATRYFTVVSPAVLCAVQNTGDGEQTIDWTGPDGTTNCVGASHYLVYASTEMDGVYTEIGKTTETKFVATGLKEGVTYFYKVRAIREFSNGDVSYGPWSNIMSMPEAGVLQLSNLSGYNVTYKEEYGTTIHGGYTGDVYSWSVEASGGSGEYSFRWSLVPMNGGPGTVIKDFSEGYIALEEGKTSVKDSCSLILSDAHISMINSQHCAIQVEVRDSLGAVHGLYSCPENFELLSFVGAKPTHKLVNVTLRAGDTLEIEYDIYEQAGDKALLGLSNPTGAVALNGNTVTALSNGYATILVTPQRFKNDILIIYNITVGYPTLTINSITPNASTLNNYSPLHWDIDFYGGRPNFQMNCKVYRDNTLVSEMNRIETANGIVSINYQPTVPGNYYLEVSIDAADDQSTTKRSAITKVVKYTPVTITPSETSSATGKNIAWVTTYNGTGTVVRRDYTLFRDGTAIASLLGTNEFVFNYTPTAAGSYVLKVVVYESNGNTISATSSTVSVYAGIGGSGSTSSTGTVNAVRVALRKGPGTSNGVILRVDKGKTVTVLSQKGDWYYVDYRGTKGWMMSKFVTLK